MKIAIASSGLGHVTRGIETWALDTAAALVEYGSQESGGRSRETGPELSVTLFCAAELQSPVPRGLSVVVLPCLKRGDWQARWLVRLAPGFTWRWGWKSGYDLEQKSFWRKLWPILRDEGFDILHVQDPLLADRCRRYRMAGKLKTREILAHGTEESPKFVAQFEFVQHLAPWHMKQVSGVMDPADIAGCRQIS